jgi:uncharacterized protein YdaU (DUF1376 family)
MNKSPAFQWYPADWLSDMRVRLLPWAAKGLYVDLLCYCWREGYIPSDSSAIAQLCGCHDLAMIEQCLELFCATDDPKKLTHKRLEKERIKQSEHRKERSNSGKKGAKTRWDKDKELQEKKDSLANGLAIKEPIAKNSSSSSSSSSTTTTTTTLKTKNKRAKFIKPTIDELRTFCKEIGHLESDGDVMFYKWEETGWKNGTHPVVSWQSGIKRYASAGWLPSQKAKQSKPTSTHHDRHANDPDGGVIDFEFAYTP